jgi:hypothetical protein
MRSIKHRIERVEKFSGQKQRGLAELIESLDGRIEDDGRPWKPGLIEAFEKICGEFPDENH